MNRTRRGALLLLAAVLLCTASSLLAPLIDTPALREHAWQGALMLGEQGATPQTVGGFKSAQLDNYSSILILKTAAYVGEEPLLLRAFGGLRVEMPADEDETGWQAFAHYEPGTQSPNGAFSYSRYWHGYILPLRVLLCFFDLANLQMLLAAVQLVLLLAVLSQLRARAARLLPGFLVAVFLFMPPGTGICLQFVPVCLITLTFCLALLLADMRMEQAAPMPVWFALCALVTNYLDLLTAPLVTLLLPLVLLLTLRIQRGTGAAALLRLTFSCCVGWAMGYAGMWMLKWGINCLAFGRGSLVTALEQASLRVSTGKRYTRLSVLLRNYHVIFAKKAYWVVMAAGACATLWMALRRRSWRSIRPDSRALVMLVPMLLPVLWYAVMANHSFDHTYFTYRSATASVLAGYALLSCLLCPKEESHDLP